MAKKKKKKKKRREGEMKAHGQVPQQKSWEYDLY